MLMAEKKNTGKKHSYGVAWGSRVDKSEWNIRIVFFLWNAKDPINDQKDSWSGKRVDCKTMMGVQFPIDPEYFHNEVSLLEEILNWE